jgi:serine protease AprX
MTIAVNGATPAGSYPLTVTGASDGLIHSIAVTLVVKPAGHFSLNVNPGTLSISRSANANPDIHANANTTVTVTSSGGFNGSVTLSVSGLPSGAAVVMGANPVKPASGSPATLGLTVTVSPTTPTGTYHVKIIGSSPGMGNQNTTLNLQVGN